MQNESGTRGRILIVDDDEPIGKLLQHWLDDEGYETRYARDTCEVAGFFEQERFDLVTLDIMMPGKDGLEVLKWIKESYPEVGVIMATALGNLKTVLEAMRGGAMGYLIKPFDLELVTEEIGLAMERQRLVAENREYRLKLEQKVEVRTRQLREAYARLEQKVRELEGRDRLVQLQMSPPADVRAAEGEILRIVVEMLKAEKAVILRPDETGDTLVVEGAPDESAGEGEVFQIPIDAEEEPISQAFRTGESRTGAGGEVIVPILYDREVLGVLWVEGMQEEEEQEVFDRLWYLGREIALVLRMVQMTTDLAAGRTELEVLLQMEGEEVDGDC